MSDPRVEYQFHQCLGKGGYGEVYLATQIRLGGLQQKVAVKVLKPDLTADHEAVRRLRDEGRMLATLQHPAILRAIDLCVLGGRVALVTEYVEGVDLSRCCKPDRLLAPRVVLAAIGEVAGALHTALATASPETGRPLMLIHRDIKPENIRLTPHGGVKLLDFGIARTSELLRDAKTRAGDLPFTPGYAAPESFRRGEQGAESDIYALGVTMYRLLVGERFYENMEVGEQFATAALPEHYSPYLEQRLQKVPAALRDLTGRMLAYDKSQRPDAGRVREMCEDLIDRLDGPTIQKWARSVQFPAPRDMEGATLSGKTLVQEPLPAAPPTGVPRGSETKAGAAPAKAPMAPAAKFVTPTPTPSRNSSGIPPVRPPPSAVAGPPSMAPMNQAGMNPASSLRAASTVAYLEEAVERHKATQAREVTPRGTTPTPSPTPSGSPPSEPTPSGATPSGQKKPPPVPAHLATAARQVSGTPPPVPARLAQQSLPRVQLPTPLASGLPAAPPKTEVLDAAGLAALIAENDRDDTGQPPPPGPGKTEVLDRAKMTALDAKKTAARPAVTPAPSPNASTAATAVRPAVQPTVSPTAATVRTPAVPPASERAPVAREVKDLGSFSPADERPVRQTGGSFPWGCVVMPVVVLVVVGVALALGLGISAVIAGLT